MPVALGYHPYFQLHDAPRDQWKVHLAAREQYVLSDVLIPTGECGPIEFTRSAAAGRRATRHCLWRPGAGRGRPRAFLGHRESGEDRR